MASLTYYLVQYHVSSYYWQVSPIALSVPSLYISVFLPPGADSRQRESYLGWLTDIPVPTRKSRRWTEPSRWG
jgi:hypothetical protein